MVTVRASLASRLSVQYFPLMDWPKHFHIPCSKASQGSCITLRTLWKNFKLKKKKSMRRWDGTGWAAGFVCEPIYSKWGTEVKQETGTARGDPELDPNPSLPIWRKERLFTHNSWVEDAAARDALLLTCIAFANNLWIIESILVSIIYCVYGAPCK